MSSGGLRWKAELGSDWEEPAWWPVSSIWTPLPAATWVCWCLPARRSERHLLGTRDCDRPSPRGAGREATHPLPKHWARKSHPICMGQEGSLRRHDSYLPISKLLFAENETGSGRGDLGSPRYTCANEDTACDLTGSCKGHEAGSGIRVHLQNHIFLDLKSQGSSDDIGEKEPLGWETNTSISARNWHLRPRSWVGGRRVASAEIP